MVMKPIQQFLLRPWLYLIIVIIGISLKFYHLDHKLFWFDEVCTIQHTSGISDGKYPNLVPVNEIKNISYYHNLYHLNTQHYTIGSQLKGLFSSTQLTPLHYSFLILWHRIVGDENTDYRLFSVFIFILTLPFLYLLAKKMFHSNLAGWIAVSLYSISPYLHIFAQEARYYILWSFFLIVLHYFLLLAIQYRKNKWWVAYIITAIFAMYTSPFTGIIIFGHLIYIWFLEKDVRKPYVFSLLIVFLCYIPWIFSLFNNRSEIVTALSWHSMKFHVGFLLPLMGQIFYFISIFSFKIDYHNVSVTTQPDLTPELLSAFMLNTLVLALLITSFVYLFRKSKKEILFFLLLIILPGVLLFYTLDIVRSSITSWWWRYLIFNTAGIILVATFFLYRKTERGNLFYSCVFIALTIMGILSIITISKTRYWFLGGSIQQVYIEDANFISKARKPLLITDYSFRVGMVDFMVVMNECKSENVDILRASPDIKDVKEKLYGKNYSDIYVFHASNKLVENLKSQFGEKMDSLEVEGISPMWQINLNLNTSNQKTEESINNKLLPINKASYGTTKEYPI
jgi:uncharacterized membrane protein